MLLLSSEEVTAGLKAIIARAIVSYRSSPRIYHGTSEQDCPGESPITWICTCRPGRVSVHSEPTMCRSLSCCIPPYKLRLCIPPCNLRLFTFYLAARISECWDCPVGHHQPSVGYGLDCNPCAPGRAQPATGQSSCGPCAPGQYQPHAGQTGPTPDPFCTIAGHSLFEHRRLQSPLSSRGAGGKRKAKSTRTRERRGRERGKREKKEALARIHPVAYRAACACNVSLDLLLCPFSQYT